MDRFFGHTMDLFLSSSCDRRGRKAVACDSGGIDLELGCTLTESLVGMGFYC